MQSREVSIASVDMYQKYMLRLRQEINEQAERVRKSMDVMDKKRAELMHARKEMKVMENLEEGQFLAYRKELAKKEQKSMDEIATQRFNLKGRVR